MRLPLTSSHKSALAKDLLKSSETGKSEDANTEIFERDEWIDFGTFDASGETRGVFGEKESYLYRYGIDSEIITSNDRKSLCLKNAENRDEQSNRNEFYEFDKAGNEIRGHLKSASQNNTATVTEISNRHHTSSHSVKKILQKWETIIRAHHGIENTGKKIEFDDTDEDLSRLHQARPVGVLTRRSIASNPTRVRRSFGLGDITNCLNSQLSKSFASNEKRADFIDINKSTARFSFSRSVSNDVTSSSNATDPTKQKKSFGLDDVPLISTHGTTTDAAGHSITSKPTRGRRSFALGDFKASIDTLSTTRTMKKNSTDISKLTLLDCVSKEKTAYSVQKLNPATRQYLQTPKSLFGSKSPERETVTSSDSDDSEFKKLYNLWNHQIVDGEIHNFCSLAHNQKSLSRLSAVGKDDKMETIPYVSENHGMNSDTFKREIAHRNTLDYVVSNDLIDSDNPEKNKSTDEKTMRAIVILEQRNSCDLIVGEGRQDNESEGKLVIRNLTLKTESIECKCSRSVFSGNEDLISFFLPQMGMACACSRNRNELIKPNDPTALENILRPWQVEFLKSLGINRAEQLVKVMHRSPGIMARGLRQWRKKYDMVSFKTSSCAIALCIWSKICKSYVRSIRRQTHAGQEDFQLGPVDAALFNEMSLFLGDLPKAPKRRDKSSDGALGIEPESQVEV